MVSDRGKDICSEEIESWSSYEYALRKEDADYFHQMLDQCRQYSDAINRKDGLIATEPMIMAVLVIQHKMIRKLLAILDSGRTNESKLLEKVG